VRALKPSRIAAVLLVLVAGCRSLEITPAVLRAEAAERPDRATALTTWTEAVHLANEFLGSSYRLTLPSGRYELDDAGMRFVTEHRTWPIRVVSSSWGDLVVRTGFAAQEREFGFVVGSQPPKRDALVDHSFFRYSSGELLGPVEVASLVLHETTHVVCREGTVGTWNAIAYYLEALFLLRASKHSAERHAHATSEEFRFFRLVESESDEEAKAIYRRAFEEHLADPEPFCVHGTPAGIDGLVPFADDGTSPRS
jgi:hypothetical protein